MTSVEAVRTAPEQGERDRTLPGPHPGRGGSGTTSARTRAYPAYAVYVVPALLALALGLWGLTRQGTMWRDESVTYQVAHRELADIWGLLANFDVVHGLYYLLMHGLFALWEGGLWALRLPSLLATAVAAVCVAALGRRLGGPRAGLLAGVVFALLPPVQMYAQEGRSYALVCACVAGATLLLVRALERPRARTWVAYGGVAWLACLLHEFAWFAVLAHGITLWWVKAPAAARRSWGLAVAAVTAGTAPLVLASLGQSGQVLWIGGPAWYEWLVMAGLAATGLACARVPARDGAPEVPVTTSRLALPLLAFPTVALLLLSLHQPVFLERYVLAYTIALALLLGTALDHALTREPRYALAASASALLALVPVAVHLREPDSRKDDLTATADAVKRLGTPGDGLLFMPSRRREWAMSYAKDYAGLRDLALPKSPTESRTLEGVEMSADEVRDAMREVMRDSGRIVALRDPVGQPLDPYDVEEVKRETLRREFVECRTVAVHGARVTLYAVSRGAC